MNDLSIFPADIAEMSVSQLANLPAQQLVEVATRYRDRLINAGHTPDVALSLLNDVVNDIHATQEV